MVTRPIPARRRQSRGKSMIAGKFGELPFAIGARRLLFTGIYAI